MSIKETLSVSTKAALKNKEKERLSVIRMALSAIKQIEVDERIEVSDERALAVLDKMVKQRKESARQYKEGNRPDLADKELREITILQEFLPEALTQDELNALLNVAIEQSSATSIKDMSKLMAILKPQLQGRADMGQVSTLIKQKLGG